MASAFAIGTNTGTMVSVAMIFHTLPEGAMAASLSIAGQISEKSARRNVLFVSGALLLGGIVGAVAAQIFDFGAYVIPFVTGILLYVSIGHLLPTALKVKRGLLGFIFGIAFMFLFLTLGHN